MIVAYTLTKSRREFIKVGALVGIEINAELRKRGVPVIGVISLQGVERGVITIATDSKGDTTYTWEYDDDDDL